jgi:hypothetical protein
VIFQMSSLAADYDSAAADKTAVGIGPGATARYWFREDTHAPRSYIDYRCNTVRDLAVPSAAARACSSTPPLSY